MKIKRFIGGALESNGYVISCDRDCYIIDPGYKPGIFIKYVTDEGLKVKGIILTHHHYDHIGGVGLISREMDCPVMIHSDDADAYGENVDIYLNDGDRLNFGEKLEILHSPGHTRGGICIVAEESKVCFTGDTIFNVDLGRTDLDDGNEQDMVSSILKIDDSWPGDFTIYPGHGDPATMKKVREINQEFIDIVDKSRK